MSHQLDEDERAYILQDAARDRWIEQHGEPEETDDPVFDDDNRISRIDIIILLISLGFFCWALIVLVREW